jgi:nucleolar pre-ribosomal-associated protein 1
MGKRTAPEPDSKPRHESRPSKLQRVGNSTGDPQALPTTTAASEEIISAKQLQARVVFEQGSASEFRSGLSLFKTFLDSILYTTDPDDLPRKRAILREYLTAEQKPGHGDHETILLPNVMTGWNYAAETNFDVLSSQIIALFALLLKVLATDATFQQFGSALCKSILHPSIAKRLNRSLFAPSTKTSIISPALRLLIEITNFNEGAHARAVYHKRDFTFDPKVIGRNLGLGKDESGGEATDRRRPTVRTLTIKYVLSHLRYQDEISKVEILSNWNVVKALFDHLHADPPHVVIDVFSVLKHHVFLDRAIPKHFKGRILSSRNLSTIAGLYRYHAPEGSLAEGQKSPDAVVHEFLMMVCTSPAMGVMLPSQGFYPPWSEGDDGDVVMEDAADIGADLYLDSTDKIENVRVRNVVLGNFIQTLKPYAHTLQQELVLAVFKCCPELVANYFVRKETFSYDPSLTSTWVGYSAFLFQTIVLSLPVHFGNRKGFKNTPPQASILIQSILPQPLTQQALTKCLNHSSHLVNYLGARVLLVAFQKLKVALDEFRKASLTRSKLWEQAGERLISEFCKRCPPMKVVILALRRASAKTAAKREVLTRLVRLYYEIIPQVALEEKFDVSIPLCTALTEVEGDAESPENKELRILELEHWVQIARQSPAMRWFQKNKSLPYSPFMTLLKLVATSSANPSYVGIKTLLITILRDYDMLQTETIPPALDALVASLKDSCDGQGPSPQVLEFLDDCCSRFTKGTIKYFDDMDTFRANHMLDGHTYGAITPLLMTIVEQWPFKGGKAEKDSPAAPIAHWLGKLLFLLKHIGEDNVLLEAVRDSLVAASAKPYDGILKDSFLWKMGKEKAKDALKAAMKIYPVSEKDVLINTPGPTRSKDIATVDLEVPPAENSKHTALHRWRGKDLDENIEDGNIGDLILCLCSGHREIRLQAVTNIRQLMASIDTTSSEDYLQLKVLLGETVETASSLIDTTPLPFVGGVFAARAVAVVSDPTHFMFGKINKFLMKGPTWIVENIPRYLTANVIRNAPTHDDTYHKEVDWLLDYLLDSLRTTADLEGFRTRNIFERLLTYYASAVCTASVKEKIVRLLFRAAAIGGSTTLITRCGVLSWIQMRLTVRDHRSNLLRLLASRLYQTCDTAKVDEWSSLHAQGMVTAMEGVVHG